MGSGMRRLPFHPEDGIGPKCIVLTPEMAKYNSRAHRIGVNHHEEVGWSQWFRFWPILSRKVPCTIVMTAPTYQRDNLVLNSNDTQQFSRTGRIILHNCLSEDTG